MQLVRASQGSVATVSAAEFGSSITSEVIELFCDKGVALMVDEHDRPMHKAGLVALVGAMKAIETGVITEGPVLCCLTEGTQRG